MMKLENFIGMLMGHFDNNDGLCIRNVRLQQQRRHARNIRFCQQSGSEYRYQ